jgi:hypothetical protein
MGSNTWEFIASDIERISVDGGWLYRTVVSDEDGISCSMCFVPTAKEKT